MQIIQQINVKNVHPVSGAGIWTRDHLKRDSLLVKLFFLEQT